MIDIKITPSEHNLLKYIVLNNKDISHKLYLSVDTIKTHIHNLSKKLKAKNRTELLIKAIYYEMVSLKEVLKMLGIEDINFLEAQNQGLIKQNQDMQKVFIDILKICNEEADSIQVLELQNRIKKVLE